MNDWSQIFSEIKQGLSEANFEQIFVQPFLKELGFSAPNNQDKDRTFKGNLDGQSKKVRPDYTCWKTENKNEPPLLVVEDKRVHPTEIKGAIEQVQEQMLITSATFGLATNGLEYQLWQRHEKICVPRTEVLPISLEKIESIIAFLKEIFKKPQTALTVMFWNEKGGIGKTTITANVAATLALKGKKVLMINLDFQGDLNVAFGFEPRLAYKPFVQLDQVLRNIGAGQPSEINKLIRTKRFEVQGSGFLRKKLIEGSIDIIPGDNNFENAFNNLAQRIDIVKLLLDEQAIYTYDYIFLDVAPSLRDLGLAGAIATDFLCPIVDNPSFAVDATLRVLNAFEENTIFKELQVPAPIVNSIIFNPRLQTKGTVKSAQAKIKEKLKGLNINYKVHSLNNYVEIDNAAEAGLPVVLYRPGSKFAKTFDELVCSIFGVE